jgi:hypothetical protein
MTVWSFGLHMPQHRAERVLLGASAGDRFATSTASGMTMPSEPGLFWSNDEEWSAMVTLDQENCPVTILAGQHNRMAAGCPNQGQGDLMGAAGGHAGAALVIVAGSSFAVVVWLFQLSRLPGRLCLIVRFRLDAALYGPAPKRLRGQRGRPARKGCAWRTRAAQTSNFQPYQSSNDSASASSRLLSYSPVTCSAGPSPTSVP